MTDQKYTKEPWGILEEEDQIRIHQNTIVFAKIPLKYLAKAERIIECVNACQGIESPLDLRRQRDELREALVIAQEALIILRSNYECVGETYEGTASYVLPVITKVLTKTKESV